MAYGILELNVTFTRVLQQLLSWIKSIQFTILTHICLRPILVLSFLEVPFLWVYMIHFGKKLSCSSYCVVSEWNTIWIFGFGFHPIFLNLSSLVILVFTYAFKCCNYSITLFMVGYNKTLSTQHMNFKKVYQMYLMNELFSTKASILNQRLFQFNCHCY